MTSEPQFPKGKGGGKKGLRRALLTMLGGLAGAPTAPAAPLTKPGTEAPADKSLEGGALAPGAAPVLDTLVYKTVSGKALSMLLAKPSAPPPPNGWPCAVFFHGGGYNAGSPEKFRALALALARHGVVAASVQYRLLGEGERIPTEGIADGRSAMRYLRGHAAKLHVDPNRIAAGGASAGGHLAMMTWLKAPFDDSSDDLSISARPQALILMNTAYNLEARFKSVEAIPLSPYHQVGPDLPPTLMIHGTADNKVPYADAVQFRDKAIAMGVKDLTLIPVQGGKHGLFQGEKDKGANLKALTEQIVGFLRRLGWAH